MELDIQNTKPIFILSVLLIVRRFKDHVIVILSLR